MATSLLLAIFTFFHFFSLGDCNFLGTNDDCVEECVNIMQKNNQMEQLSYPSLRMKDDKMTEASFKGICDSFEKADKCLQRCAQHNLEADKIRMHTYAGIRYICIEKRNEFFRTLPCLSEHEPKAMSKCSSQINESIKASTEFSNTVINKESHHLRHRFESLCESLGNTVACIEPITRESCGEDAADMMMKFIKVGFGSFEQVYSQLGISDQLPSACRSLLSPSRSNSKTARRTANESRTVRSFLTLITVFAFSLLR
ncbi:hypothetical protein PENTCL1PPCAC_6239 [Pristionchus entomophagus]|uniref:Chondroitin proteoglycan 4 domain-containing protein n=1 Tax=Pristionchus entomophagus TaxID=358040 RepID=A0AAV5SMC4_9BILA|nr:hypothetical protein PENTCL1PPCAC_6239 [Pristionchus entomophagus]